MELCSEVPISGLQELYRGPLIDVDRSALEKRMRAYYDPAVEWDTLRVPGTGLTQDAGRFNAAAARKKVQEIETFNPAALVRYAFRPFDVRWCYYSKASPLWNRARPALAAQGWPGNTFIITRMMAERPQEQVAILVTSALPDYHLLRPNAVAIPVRLRPTPPMKHAQQIEADFADADATPKANLSSRARTYLASLGMTNADADDEVARLAWMHALAVGYSPAYVAENADGIRQDWPRVPLPRSGQSLLASGQLGRQVAALLDTEGTIPGVTTGTIRPELAVMAIVSRVGGGLLNLQGGELALTAGWGHAGQGGVMPGRGRLVKREYTPMERAAIEDGAKALGVSPEEAFLRLGTTTFDIYLNELAFWANVPLKVWAYTIGGFPVIKKWLSYRERDLLGRDLTPDEVREVRDIARRIAALLLLEPSLDANYQAVKAETYEWGSGETAC